MRVGLEDDAGFEAYQFAWFALTFARAELRSVLAAEASLRGKLERVGRALPGEPFGRVLREPCAVELSDAELLVLGLAFVAVEWEEGAAAAVLRSMRHFGLRVHERQLRTRLCAGLVLG